MNIQIFVEGEGILDVAELRRAVAEAGRSAPGSRLVRRQRRWVDSGRDPQVRVLDGARLNRATFEGLPELFGPLRGDRGEPTAEVVLLSGPRPTVVFRAYHGVMDGKGALNWVAEVFRALRGEPLHGAPDRITDVELLDRIGVPDDAGEPENTVASPLNTPARFSRRGHVYLRRTVEGLHPAAVAKLAVALNRLCGGANARYLVPVDLRRHDESIRSTANLTLHVGVDVDAEDTWDQVQHRLLEALRANEELGMTPNLSALKMPLPVLRPLGGLVDLYMARRNIYSGSFFLTHLGRHETVDFSTPTFHAGTIYSPPTRGMCSPPVLSLVETNGRTEMILAADGGPGMRERARDLMDGVHEAFSPQAARTWSGNRTGRELRGPDTLTGMFAEQVRATPDRIALTDPDGEYSYAELDRASDAIAASLHGHGVGAGAVVGLVADRTVGAVAGLWGVLKCGAAYLPLDPGHPDARLRELLAEAGAAACLRSPEHRDRALTPPGCPVVSTEQPEHTAGAAPSVEVAPDDLAYVIYTSGSTGRPKGVEVTHSNVVNYVSWARERFADATGTRFALFTSLAFDLPNTALFTPLLSGGSLALVREEPNRVSLRAMLTERGVTALKLTPSHLDLIIGLGLTAPDLRLLVVGGERLDPALAARAAEQFGPGCRIVNHYGPTETTIGCVVHEIAPGTETGNGVPIGLPAANTQVFLRDPDGRPVESGEAGEMYLAGAQVARGYRGRPDLTAERFVTLPHGVRAYRSGDLARIRPDGLIEYLGRIDDQVKVLGHRIEPGEIAAALERHPAVERAHVIARTRNGQGSKALVAYVVSPSGVDAGELREHAAGLLPAYMVPATSVVVDELPRTANGKLDVRALPDPFDGRVQPCHDGGPGAAPEPGAAVLDEVSSAVARIWSDALGVPEQDLHAGSDFTLLGGDSVHLLTMLATVSDSVLGPGREEAFMSGLGRIIARPTLENVSAIARDVRDGRAALGAPAT